MRRISLWALSTLATLLLLFGYHTSTAGVQPSARTLATSGVYAGGTSTGSAGSPPAGSDASSAVRTVTGDPVSTRWGPVQVAIEVDGGDVTGISVPVHPDRSSKDEQINGYALPILIRESLSAQSAQVDMVSGATVTSVGYTQSLQSALDRAGL